MMTYGFNRPPVILKPFQIGDKVAMVIMGSMLFSLFGGVVVSIILAYFKK